MISAGIQALGRPSMLTDIEQVHSRPIGEIDRSISTQQNTRGEIADQLDPLGLLVNLWSFLRNFHDLTAGKALIRLGSSDLKETLSPTDRFLQGLAFIGGRRVHPNRTFNT